MIGRIDHVGVLVRSLEETLPLYTELLGLTAETPVELPEQAVRVAFIHPRAFHGVSIELRQRTGSDNGG
jgi:methylmalonyl-CoA/ethylmalonyl-CoA epimerase